MVLIHASFLIDRFVRNLSTKMCENVCVGVCTVSIWMCGCCCHERKGGKELALLFYTFLLPLRILQRNTMKHDKNFHITQACFFFSRICWSTSGQQNKFPSSHVPVTCSLDGEKRENLKQIMAIVDSEGKKQEGRHVSCDSGDERSLQEKGRMSFRFLPFSFLFQWKGYSYFEYSCSSASSGEMMEKSILSVMHLRGIFSEWMIGLTTAVHSSDSECSRCFHI